MADIGTSTATSHFQQLRNRQNDLYRKNTQAMIAAAKAGDRDLVDDLRAERATLSENDAAILDAELAFQATELSQSDAEKRLVKQTAKANRLVKSIATVAQILESAGKMAAILARLIKLLA